MIKSFIKFSRALIACIRAMNCILLDWVSLEKKNDKASKKIEFLNTTHSDIFSDQVKDNNFLNFVYRLRKSELLKIRVVRDI